MTYLTRRTDYRSEAAKRLSEAKHAALAAGLDKMAAVKRDWTGEWERLFVEEVARG